MSEVSMIDLIYSEIATHKKKLANDIKDSLKNNLTAMNYNYLDRKWLFRLEFDCQVFTIQEIEDIVKGVITELNSQTTLQSDRKLRLAFPGGLSRITDDTMSMPISITPLGIEIDHL